MGVCGQVQTRSRKSSLECYFERGNDEQKQFHQRLLSNYNCPIQLSTKISDDFNKYYILLTDMGNKYVIQDGGFVNNEEMINTILNLIYDYLKKNREENAA